MILSPFLMQEQSTRLWVCVFKLAAVKLGNWHDSSQCSGPSVIWIPRWSGQF